MANKKISELNEASSLNNSDVMPVVQGNETKKSTLSTLISFLNSKLSFLKSSDISTTISSSSTDDKAASEKAVYTYVPPKSHASSATTYGVGTTANYGHCRTINNLTTSSHTNGYALSAYQGYILNRDKQAKLTAGTNITIDSNNVISASGGGSLSLISVNNSQRLAITVPSAWTNVKLDLDNTTVTTGDYTLSNGAVVVGAKPKVVEAYFSCALDTLTSGTYNFYLKKTHNGTTTVEFAFAFSGVATIWNPQGSAIFEVSEGDKIEIYATKNGNGTFYGGITACILTVKTLSETGLTAATTNSINPSASLMNTGSLVGMGDRADLGVIGDNTNATDQMNETTNTTNDSGDTI